MQPSVSSQPTSSQDSDLTWDPSQSEDSESEKEYAVFFVYKSKAASRQPESKNKAF